MPILRRMLRRLCLSAVLAVLAVVPAPIAAQTIEDLVRVDILPGWRTDDGRHMAGIRIRLAPGWKTYWRAPGDSGIPPLFNWQEAENLASFGLQWPIPEVSWLNGMRSIGYKGEVTLPLEVQTIDPDAPVRISGQMLIGICESVCVPVELDLEATLPADHVSRDPAIVAALIDRPMTAEEAGVGRVTCEVAPIDGGLRVTATMDLPRSYQSDVVIIETADPEVWVSEPEVVRRGGSLQAESELLHVSGEPFALDRSGVRITVLAEEGRAVDIQGCTSG